MEDFTTWNDWDLQSRLRNPMGPAAALSPGVETPAGPTMEQMRETKDAIRAEFRERGYTDEDIALVETGDYGVITRHHAERE